MPAAIEATCVPWPTRSTVSSAELKFFSARTWPLRSGWVVSVPVSRTAILTPLPVNPALQAVGAPICGTLLSRLARRTPSSQTRSMPAAVVTRSPSPGPAVSAFQISGTSPAGVVTDSAFSEVRLRPTSVPPASRTCALAAWACLPR